MDIKSKIIYSYFVERESHKLLSHSKIQLESQMESYIGDPVMKIYNDLSLQFVQLYNAFKNRSEK